MQNAIARLQSKNTLAEYSKKELDRAYKMFKALPVGEPVIVKVYSYADDEYKYIPSVISKYSEINRRGTRENFIIAQTNGFGRANSPMMIEPIDPSKSWRI